MNLVELYYLGAAAVIIVFLIPIVVTLEIISSKSNLQNLYRG